MRYKKSDKFFMLVKVLNIPTRPPDLAWVC